MKAYAGRSTYISRVAGERTYFEAAADALERAMRAPHVGEQAMWLDEALRLDRLALAEEKAKLASLGAGPPPPDPANAKAS